MVEKELDYSIWVIFRPRYNEMSIFLSGLAFFLLLVSSSLMRQEIWDALFGGGWTSYNVIAFILAVILFVSGFVLSAYHIFAVRKKRMIEKRLMIALAMGINILAGAAGGGYIWNASNISWLLLFPLWSIFSAVILSAFFLMLVNPGPEFITKFSKDLLSDFETDPVEILFGTVALFAVFLLFQHMLQTYWAITLSACVLYSSVVNRFLTGYFLKNRPY
jgi:hypothetical protein